MILEAYLKLQRNKLVTAKGKKVCAGEFSINKN